MQITRDDWTWGDCIAGWFTAAVIMGGVLLLVAMLSSVFHIRWF